MANSLDLTDLVAATGDYCRENKAQIFSDMLLDDRFEERVTVMDGVTDEMPLPRMTIGDIVKPADAETFSPNTGAIKFSARKIKARGMKVDLLIVPQKLYATWLGMAKKEGRADTQYLPLQQFIMDYIVKKARENVHLRAIFKGVYNDAGTSSVDTMDGYLKLIADEIAANNISVANNNLVLTGAITQANIIDKFESVYDKLDEAYKSTETQMLVNPTLFRAYQRAYRNEFGGNTDYTQMSVGGFVKLDGANCNIVSEPGLGTSQRIILTPKENLCFGVDSLSDLNALDIQKFDRTMKILMDFSGGVQFNQIDKCLVVNDQA